MSKIPFFNSFGRKPATNQNDNLVDTIVSELLEAPSQSSVDIPSEKAYGPGMSEWKPSRGTPIGVQKDSVHSAKKFICEACPVDVAKSHGSPTTLAYHVKEHHPAEWPFQLIIPKSKNHAKKWKPGQIKTVMDTYLQQRATQNVGRHFIANRIRLASGELRVRNAYWVNCSEHPDTSNYSHIKALNAASVAVGRNSKSVRDVLNGTLGRTQGLVKHQAILVRQLGGIGPQCELTAYGLKRIKQIRDKCGYVGLGGIEGLESLRQSTVTQTHIELVSDDVVQQPKQSDPVVGDPAVMKPLETQETEVDGLVWKSEPSNIVSTWAGLTNGVLKYVSELQQQVSDLKNRDQNRGDLEDTYNKEIAQKDKIIMAQKEHIVELNKNGETGKERDDLKIQVQNLTEERNVLLTANEALVQQAKAHNKEKQSSTLAKKVDVQSLENRMSTLMKELENMKKDLE